MNEKVSMLKEKAKELRKTALTMIFEAQSGHPGGSLSSADIVTALYFSEMHVDPKKSAVARQGQVRPFKRPCLPDPVRGSRQSRIFPGGSAAHPASGRLHASGSPPACSNARA